MFLNSSHATRQLKQKNFTECGIKQSNQQCTGMSQNNDWYLGIKKRPSLPEQLLASIVTASGNNFQKKCNYA